MREPPPLFGRGSAVALVCGAAWALSLPGLPPFGRTIVAAITLLAVATWRPSRLAVFAFGFAYTCAHAHWAIDARLPHALEGAVSTIDARVVGLPAAAGRGVRFDAWSDTLGHLRLSSFDPGFKPHPGERWRLEAKLKRPRGLVNPAGFDFEMHAALTGVAATGYVRRVDRRLPAEPFDCVRSAPDRLRLAFASFVEKHRADPATAIVRALAIGDTRAVADQTWDVFRTTGTTHLVAISGLHVAFVASLGLVVVRALYFVAPRLALQLARPRADALGTLAVAVVYALVAGASVPVLRTVAMIAVVLLSRWRARRTAPSQSLALAAIVLILVDPLTMLAPGFWLSFAGVAWLLFCLGGRARIPAWRELGHAQLAVSIGLAPLTIVFFGQLSLIGPVANLFAVPWISLVCVPLSLLALAAFLVVPSFAPHAVDLAAASVDLALTALQALARVPHAEWHPPDAPGLAAVLAGIGAVWLLAPSGTPARALGLALLLPIAMPRTDRPARGEFDVHVLDVGQGLAVLVRTASHAVLYDAGAADADGFDLGASVVVPSLRALGVTRLDRFIVSHEDRDHAGGAASVMRAFAPSIVLRAAGQSRCAAGQRWTFDGVSFEVLHPPRDFPALGNDSSCVLRIASAAGVALLPGDVGEVVEQRLARGQGGALDADLVIAPHHGSRSSSSEAWVAATSPSLVAYSRGHRHQFGHPHRSVVLRYATAAATRLDTATDGAIRVRFAIAGVSVARERLGRPRFWRESTLVE